ncbi:Uncharacterised protein [Bordetella pertussis]|nr:Uncharacterised protein [Bordetella pertussis]
MASIWASRSMRCWPPQGWSPERSQSVPSSCREGADMAVWPARPADGGCK